MVEGDLLLQSQGASSASEISREEMHIDFLQVKYLSRQMAPHPGILFVTGIPGIL